MRRVFVEQRAELLVVGLVDARHREQEATHLSERRIRRRGSAVDDVRQQAGQTTGAARQSLGWLLREIRNDVDDARLSHRRTS